MEGARFGAGVSWAETANGNINEPAVASMANLRVALFTRVLLRSRSRPTTTARLAGGNIPGPSLYFRHSGAKGYRLTAA